MSIRTITVAGRVAGYQALAGNGGRGLSAYVPATAPDARRRAEALERELALAHRCQRLGSAAAPDPLRGLRLALRPSKSADRPPVLYAEAQWRQDGRPVHRSCSAQRHGLLDAVTRALCALVRGTGRHIDMSPQQVLEALQQRTEGAP